MRERTEGWSQPSSQFAGEMLLGIPASQDGQRSESARSLPEEIPLLTTEDRRSRNRGAECLEGHGAERRAERGSRRGEPHTVRCLERSEVRKQSAQKMEYWDPGWAGSEGAVPAGDGWCSVTAAEVAGGEIPPRAQKLFSSRAQDFVSEPAEILAAVDPGRACTNGRGMGAVDRGGDRKKLREPLLEKEPRCGSRFTGQRSGIHRQQRRTVHRRSVRGRLRDPARIVSIENGPEKRYELRYGAEPIRRPGREEKRLLVVVAGFGAEPLLRWSNRQGVRDSSALWWMVRIYLTRWNREETFRFVQQSYPREDIRVLRDPRLQSRGLLVPAAAGFATTFLGQTGKLQILGEKLRIISRRLGGIPPFRFDARSDGIQRILSRSAPPMPAEPPPTFQRELLLGWNP